jgi:molecular chaperone DnaK
MAKAKSKNGVFLVYDLGGGTFDLALVQSTAGAVAIIGHEGINMLGGRDLDTAILNQLVRPWLLGKFDLPDDFQKDARWARIMRVARSKAEKAKKALSGTEREIIFASDEDIRATDLQGHEIYLDVPLDRRALEDLVRPQIDQTVELSRKLLHASGYRHEDIDRIVLIGGPSKMPGVRDMVPRGLGIPVDMQIDPMTAVAYGAAIFAESREWLSGATQRKTVRASQTSAGALRLRFDFPARVTDERARLWVRPDSAESSHAEIDVEAEDGWRSGRRRVGDEAVIDLSVTALGENRFTVNVFARDGRPVTEAGSRLIIVRAHASAAGIPATQTIAVKILVDKIIQMSPI